MYILHGHPREIVWRTMGLIIFMSVMYSGDMLDLSTPRAVLAAHWVNQDAYAAISKRLTKELRAVETTAIADSGVRALLTEDALKGQDASASGVSDAVVVYDRKIVEEQKMRDDSVMVSVRITNASPLPSGVKLTEEETKTRAEGERLRYRLVLTPSGWRISQVYTYRAWRSEDDESQRWSPLYKDDSVEMLYMYVHINPFLN